MHQHPEWQLFPESQERELCYFWYARESISLQVTHTQDSFFARWSSPFRSGSGIRRLSSICSKSCITVAILCSLNCMLLVECVLFFSVLVVHSLSSCTYILCYFLANSLLLTLRYLVNDGVRTKLEPNASLEDCGVRGALCRQRKYQAIAVFNVWIDENNREAR
jgi:hypothetical protein